MNIASILKKIIKKNSTLSPTILIDEEGVFEDYIQELEEVRLMKNPSNITNIPNIGKYSIYYSC